jgi:hypothetical protein
VAWPIDLDAGLAAVVGALANATREYRFFVAIATHLKRGLNIEDWFVGRGDETIYRGVASEGLEPRVQPSDQCNEAYRRRPVLTHEAHIETTHTNNRRREGEIHTAIKVHLVRPNGHAEATLSACNLVACSANRFHFIMDASLHG